MAQSSKDTADAETLDTIEVVTRHPRGWPMPLPGSVAWIRSGQLREAQRQVNLSEALQRVPGLTAFDRNNYAQDLQIQSRGFGARSSFGIRGIRLIVDGIPSSAADGQGQAAAFPLSSLDSIDVLRGPLALRHGGAPGGVIVGTSTLDAGAGADADLWTGSDDSWRANLRVDGRNLDGRLRWRAQAGGFATAGARPHSAARRNHVNALAEWTPSPRERLRIVFNSVHQPLSQDPLGLTRASFSADAEGTDPLAIRFDARKRLAEDQWGLGWRRDLENGGQWRLSAYRSERSAEQFLAIPVAAQQAPGSAGGVVDLRRVSNGIEAGRQWRGGKGTLDLVVEIARLDEDRRGYENFVGSRLGVRGRLRRDERNRVDRLDAAITGDLKIGDDWTLLAGVRGAWLRYRSHDRFVANGDDGGRGDDTRLAWSLGAEWAYSVPGTVYLHLGEHAETPTLNELSYRADGGAGFNRDLTASRARSFEVGSRWRGGWGEASLAAYRIDSRDEIVPALNRGGRASFTNAGATRRQGIELGVQGGFGKRWRYALAASLIDARFEESFSFVVLNDRRTVAEGNRMPGIPRSDLFAELQWRSDDGRWSSALESRAVGSIAVDDRNTDAAPGNARFAWRLQWQGRGGWRAFARVDNLLGRSYAGSVIVNEANGRFFEPAPGRGFTLGVAWNGQR